MVLVYYAYVISIDSSLQKIYALCLCNLYQQSSEEVLCITCYELISCVFN
jgi:hypothetical protein